MPLPLPNLDTRRWTDLVDEGRALIPRYAPEWTDHNTHDPGITLVDLFAWLAEMSIYRLNQVPERHQRKFLELVGFVPRPPQAALAMLSFSPQAGAPFVLAAGAEFETPAGVPFRTLRDLTVAAVALKAILVDAGDGVLRDHTGEWLDSIPIACLGTGIKAGAALYLGFDTLPSGATIALGLRVSGPRTGEEERERILDEMVADRALCRPVLPEHPCPGAPQSPPFTPKLVHHSARIVWEAFTGTWTTVTPATDDTCALTIDGIVELPVPAGMVATALGNVAAPLSYFRCRLVSGSYDATPLLLDAAPNTVWAEQAVPETASFVIAEGVVAAGVPPAPGSAMRFDAQLDFAGRIQALTFLPPGTAGHPDIVLLGYGAAGPGTQGKLTVSMARAGYSDGTPNQRMFLPGTQVEQESLQLFTHGKGVWQEWNRREDLDASRRTDFHFVVDAASGEITFGDGEQGRVPPAGSTVVAVYRRTAGKGGNQGPLKITAVADSPWNSVLLPPAVRSALTGIVTNRGAATGGIAQEDVAGAAGRAVEVLHAHERLVEIAQRFTSDTLDQITPTAVRAIHAPSRAANLLDIERLAVDAPGTRVARARAWSGFDANYRCLRTSGVVTVMIVPDLNIPRPMPSPGLIAAVQRYLDLRRLVCTRIVVAAPDYVEVRVSARISVIRGAGPARVTAAVIGALNAFLDPRKGGPAGFGWPFGRDVFRSEILQVIQEVPGVDHAVSLSLSADGGTPQCGNLALCATALVTPGQHRIDTV